MSREPGPVNAGQLSLLAGCFALSGTAALAYQTAWTREFALVFGTSELAVATVLAAYMGGLAAGAWLIERFLPRVSRPVMAYAVLELGIALSAVALVPLLLAGASRLLVALFGGAATPPSSEHLGISIYYAASAFVALAAPATLMGATLPLLARHAVHADAQVGRRIGLLYAVNTAGAVLGALATAFWWLPSFGLRTTVWIAAALNSLVFVLAALLARSAPLAPPSGAAPAAPALPAAQRYAGRAWLVLPIMLCSGAVAFLHEVLWTRMLSHIVGGSVQAFGVMVATFLAGIALGGAVAAWYARQRASAALALAITQLGIAAAAAAAFLMLDRLVPDRGGLAANIGLGFALLLPLTLFVGATFPLAVRVLATGPDDAAPASARVFAWNTVGAIAGAIAGGFLIIPALRYEGAVRAAVIASSALAVVTVWLFASRRTVIAVTTTAIALAGALAFRPGIPTRLLTASPIDVPPTGSLLFYDVGRSASVIVLQQDGGLALRTNGLPEAIMDTPGMAPRFNGESWMAPLAAIARPGLRDLLIVGYGGGMVIEAVPPSVAHIDVIELEPDVIEANRATRHLRRRDPLADPRVNIVTNDARGALRLTDRRYGAIVSQPSHPWTAGASHLYTREFMRLARERLTDDGVFVQWMNVAFLDEPLLRSLAATLCDVFPHVRIYRPDPATLVLLASAAPLDLETRVARTGQPLDLAPRHYARLGINNAEDLVVALAADEAGTRALAAGAPLITDDRNRMATSSVYQLGRGLTHDAAGRVLAPYDPLQRADSQVMRELVPVLAMHYVARRLVAYVAIDASERDRVGRLGALLGDTAAGAFARALAQMLAGGAVDAGRLLAEAQAAYPDDAALRFEVLRPFLSSLAAGQAPQPIARLAVDLPPSAAALIAALRAQLQGDLDALPKLDPALATARWTDPWSLPALQVRADWRTRVATPTLRRTLGDEALGLLDRAIVQQGTAQLFALRVQAAVSLERPDMVVESSNGFALATLADASRMSDRDQARARATLDAMAKLVSDTAQKEPWITLRAQEVQEAIQKARSAIA
jgi:spermidine synthase